MLWGFLRIFLKIRFSAKKSGSRPRCRTKLKILWNTQKTPTKHALRHFRKLLKIRFLAEKSGSQLRCRIMLKIPWNTQKTPTKRVLILNNLLAMVRCLGQPTLFILLSTLTSVASDLFNNALWLDNELAARPPRGRHGLWTGLKTQMGCLQIVWWNQ